MKLHAVRSLVISVLATGGIATLAAQQPGGDPVPRFKSSADVVTIQAAVRNGKGRPVAGLTAADFERSLDAFPIEYRAFELQGLARYEKLDEDDDDRLTLEPRLEWGFAPNWQAKVISPFFAGTFRLHRLRRLLPKDWVNAVIKAPPSCVSKSEG